MKKQYIFVILIIILFYMLFLVINYKYREYKINSYIEEIQILNKDIKKSIDEIEGLIVYKSTFAYKNKLMKQEQGLKNKKEKVLYLTDEKEYEKYTNPNYEETYKKAHIENFDNTNDIELKTKTNFQKWIYFIFK